MVFYGSSLFDLFSYQTSTSCRSPEVTTQQPNTSHVQEVKDGRCCFIRKQLQSRGISKSASDIIASSWRDGTRKQYDFAWKKWYFWCLRRHSNPFVTTEEVVVSYLNFLRLDGKSYSVINTHKSMLLQTLQFFDNDWCNNPKDLGQFPIQSAQILTACG